MSKRELIRSLFDYNEWANNAILDAASRVAEDEVTRDLGRGGAGHGSLQGILLHILGSHVSWLMKWTGEPTRIARVEPGRVVPAVRESYNAAHERLRASVSSLTDAALDAETELMDPQGRPVAHLASSPVAGNAQHRNARRPAPGRGRTYPHRPRPLPRRDRLQHVGLALSHSA